MRHLSSKIETLVDHPRGLLLTISLFVSLRLGEITLIFMTGTGRTLTSARELAIGTGLDVALFCLLLLGLTRLGDVDIRRLFFGRLPNLWEGVKWGSVGIVCSIPGFIHATSVPTYFGYEGYVTFVFLHIAQVTIAMPCIEETLFRGVCFGSLLVVGRLQAYAISTILFLLWHVTFVDLIIKGSTGLDWPHAAIITVFGLVTAYVYEKTGKLTLCIIFHGAGNALVSSAPFFLYLQEYFLTRP